MPYSVMIWLVDPGDEAVEERSGDGEARKRQRPRGASGGFTARPRSTCLSYGLFESEIDVEDALTMISESLRRNAPIRVTHGNRTFLVPAGRVHYVVCDEVTRPRDETG